MTVQRAARGAGGFVLALLLTGLFPGVAAAADTVAFRIKDVRITESSGLAADPDAGIYWTVNDSGSTGTAYGVEPDGKVRGTLNYRVEPVDVEAVAFHDDRLYVADIGDNEAVRDQITVYYFNQPRASGLTVGYRAWDFEYPDGAHDAEALLVNGNGRLFVVTKEAMGGIYRAPKEPTASGVNRLTRVGDAPSLVTDGTFLPGGDQLALLSYNKVTVLDAKSYEQAAEADIPKQKQAESLAVSLDESTLLVGSEGKRSRVYAIPIPGASTASPTPTATASGQTDSGDVDEDTEGSGGLGNAGTFLAVGLAGFVALVAGVVVARARTR